MALGLMGRKGGAGGAAYLAVLILVLILTLSGLALVRLGELQGRWTEVSLQGERALAAAEGCAERLVWALGSLRSIEAASGGPGVSLNPFGPQWCADPSSPTNVTGLLDLLNPGPFPPRSNQPYCWIVWISAAGSRVRAEILAAVDTDGDGMEGLGDEDGDGRPSLSDADLQDPTRFFRVLLGLQGSVGRGISAGGRDLVDASGRSLVVRWEQRPWRTILGRDLAGFWRGSRLQSTPPWRRYDVVISRELLRGRGRGDLLGEPRFPEGLFQEDGAPNPSFFSRFNVRVLDGDRIFDGSHDPTSGLAPGTILWVNGDVTLGGVDLGVLAPDGRTVGSDWTRTDVVIVSTGEIRVRGVDCGPSGRLLLIGRDVSLYGVPDGRVLSGVILAGRAVRLLAEPGLDPSVDGVQMRGGRPARASYFRGILLAGREIRVEGGGWALIHDSEVINGCMGRRPSPLVLDRFEGSGLSSCWRVSGQVTGIFQGGYLEDERGAGAGDSGDTGQDQHPQLLRITVAPSVSDAGTGEEVAMGLDGESGEECGTAPQDWRSYGAIHLLISQDNYRRRSPVPDGGGLTTERESRLFLFLEDDRGHRIEYPLNGYEDPLWGRISYSDAYWGTEPYDLSSGDVTDPSAGDDYRSGRLPRWRSLRIPLAAFRVPGGSGWEGFDLQKVGKVGFRVESVSLRWTLEDPLGHPLLEEGLRSDPLGGGWVFESQGGCPQEVDLQEGRLVRLSSSCYTAQCQKIPQCSVWEEILWDADGEDQDGDGDYRDDPLTPADLVFTIRVDHLSLPGSVPMDYGYPQGLPLEVHLWRELSRAEAGH